MQVVASLVELAHLRNLSVKDHHVFRSDIGRGYSFVCERERINAYSEVRYAPKKTPVAF